MEPKEKAKELVSKFEDFANYYVALETKEGIVDLEENKKQCALITVDELLYNNKTLTKFDNIDPDLYEFWQEVKTEIEKL